MVDLKCPCARTLATLARRWDGRVVLIPRKELAWSVKPMAALALAAGEPRPTWLAIWEGEGAATVPASMTVTCDTASCSRRHRLSPDTAASIFREAAAAGKKEITLGV